MKKVKFNKKQIIFLISICLILIIAIVSVMNKTEIIKFARKVLNLETKEITYEVYSNENNKIKLVVTVTDTENGIAEITDPDNDKLMCQGQNEVAFDYVIEENREYTFTSISTTSEEKSITILVNDEFRDNLIQLEQIEKITTEQNYKIIRNNNGKSTYTYYYAIGENNTTWEKEPSYNIVNLDSYKIYQNGWINEDGTVTLKVKKVGSDGNKVEISKKITDLKLSEDLYNETEQTLEGDSIIACIQNNTITSGNYLLKVNGEEYPAEIYNYDENVNYVTDKNLGTAEADTRMLIMKYNGNLTVDTERIITAQTGKKGMFIYTAGTLTNNGEISMTARGAHAVGQDVYLLKHENGIYEYVPAIGASGGGAVQAHNGSTGANGGISGIDRQTGGGASGNAYASGGYKGAGQKYYYAYAWAGAGSAGTSYSGGTGGGSARASQSTMYNYSHSGGGSGEINGGAGGATGTPYYGAGNPSGGTGGLLIIYADTFNNELGKITSNGSNASGGASGGGSINIFYNQNINTGTITATGGAGAGKGGDGCITLQDINIKSPIITIDRITINSFKINVDINNPVTDNITFDYYVDDKLVYENETENSKMVKDLNYETEYKVKVIMKYNDSALKSNDYTVITLSIPENMDIYVDSVNGDDNNGDGSKEYPYSTLDNIYVCAKITTNIYLSDGEYKLNTNIFNLLAEQEVNIIGQKQNTSLIVGTLYGNNNLGGSTDYKINFYRLIWKSENAMFYNPIAIKTNMNFYNVVFDITEVHGYSYFSANNDLDMYNCVSLNENMILRKNTYTIKLTNCYGVYTNGYQTVQSDFDYQTNYITSSPQLNTTTYEITEDESLWKSVGTGTNLDGTQANLGVYGGEYSWEN